MKKSLLSFSVAVFVLLAAGNLSLYAHNNADVDAQTQASVPDDAQTSVQKPAKDAQTSAQKQSSSTSTSKKSNKQTVVLQCDLHCKGCCDKIMKNIAFEKGVKDLVCDLDKKTVTVTYDTRKTDLDTLLAAFARIGKPATLAQPNALTEPAKPIEK